MKSSRIIPIEAFRFLFMMQICWWHFNKGLGYLQSGFLGVEFFYIISGVFIYYKTQSASEISSKNGVISYVYSKLEKFYLGYVFSIFLMYIVLMPKLYTLFLMDPIHQIFRIVGQLLMFQNIGLEEGGVNPPLWFFSVLVYGSVIIYSLVRYYEKISIRILFPVICLSFYSYIFSSGKGIGLEQWEMSGPFSMPLLRGIVDMALGVIIGYISMTYKKTIQACSRILDYIFFLSIIGYLIILFWGKNECQYALVSISVFVFVLLNPNSKIQHYFESPAWVKLGAITFDIFLIHWILRDICMGACRYFEIPTSYGFIGYTMLLVPMGFVYRNCMRWLKIRLNRYLSYSQNYPASHHY